MIRFQVNFSGQYPVIVTLYSFGHQLQRTQIEQRRFSEDWASTPAHQPMDQTLTKEPNPLPVKDKQLTLHSKLIKQTSLLLEYLHLNLMHKTFTFFFFFQQQLI